MIAKIKRRYKRFRYYLNWRFPKLYQLLCAVKFPLQLAVLCLGTVTSVNFYNAHYSSAAVAERYDKTTPAGNTQVLKNQPTVTTASNGATHIESEQARQQQASKAESLIKVKKQPTDHLEDKLDNAKQLPGTPNPGPDTPIQMRGAEWLLQLPGQHYVAQIAAATDQLVLLDYAADNHFSEPLAVYPFKINKNGTLVYGLSTGLFITLEDARTELPVLNKLSEQHGVWVRKVAEIKEQITTLKQNQILHQAETRQR